jgi:PIN domain nuclease of toxin-antitoxin system
MRFLIDTHALIWFIIGDKQLSTTARQLIETPQNERLVSIVSLWEIAPKMSLGKLNMGATFDQLIPQQLIENDMTLLPIEVSHLYQLVQLPFHHRDPFDRLLIAQGLSAGLPPISRDPQFDAYPVQRLWL